MPVTEETAGRQVPTLRPVQEWERGFTVVLAPLDEEAPTAHQLVRLCEIARMDEETARAFLAARVSLPVARVGTAAEAGLVARLLGAADLGAAVLPDERLALDRQTRRVREIRLGPASLDALVLWGAWDSLPRDEVALAVEGRVVGTKVEIVEGAGRGRRGASDPGETAQFFVETHVVDVYGPTLERSFRVKADSFDFACLGVPPGPRLDDNVAALTGLLSQYLGPSRYDASYSRVARLVGHAWPAESQVQSHGLKRRGDFRKYTRSSVTTDGLAQFTRYSRMLYALSGLAGAET
jgi:hypothetical protein